MHPSHSWKAALLVVSAISAAACASLTVRSYTTSNADVRRYATYSWATSHDASTGDPRLDGNRFFAEHVQSRVDAELARRGYEKREHGQPSLVVHYHASVTQQIDLRAIDSSYAGTSAAEPYVYDAGTLVIDLVDARTNALVWRGWAEGSLEGGIDHQASMEAQVARAVARILRRLPRRM